VRIDLPHIGFKAELGIQKWGRQPKARSVLRFSHRGPAQQAQTTDQRQKKLYSEWILFHRSFEHPNEVCGSLYISVHLTWNFNGLMKKNKKNGCNAPHYNKPYWGDAT